MPNEKTSSVLETQEQSTPCGCATDAQLASTPAPKLEDLIPIALVIAAGCESCAEKMVTRALEQGSPWRHIHKTLQVAATLQKLECFAQAVGPEAVARMTGPLAAGRGALQRAAGCAGK